jgi:hypothetical protein
MGRIYKPAFPIYRENSEYRETNMSNKSMSEENETQRGFIYLSLERR